MRIMVYHQSMSDWNAGIEEGDKTGPFTTVSEVWDEFDKWFHQGFAVWRSEDLDAKG